MANQQRNAWSAKSFIIMVRSTAVIFMARCSAGATLTAFLDGLLEVKLSDI
jgi:hypothetical protein